MNITTKRQMYNELIAKTFGNTVPCFFSLETWDRHLSDLWGVRSLVANDPDSRLNVPTAEVENYLQERFSNKAYNLSPMVDHRTQARFMVADTPSGITLDYVIGYAKIPWRDAFASLGRTVEGSAVGVYLRRYLNENSYDDLMILLENYPNHVVELTALDCCMGNIPNRNAIIWEVRCY